MTTDPLEGTAACHLQRRPDGAGVRGRTGSGALGRSSICAVIGVSLEAMEGISKQGTQLYGVLGVLCLAVSSDQSSNAGSYECCTKTCEDESGPACSRRAFAKQRETHSGE